MIPDVTIQQLRLTLKRFDREQRSGAGWADWTQNDNHNYVIEYEGQFYPIKHIIFQATGAEVSSFEESEAYNYLAGKTFKVVPRAGRTGPDIIPPPPPKPRQTRTKKRVTVQKP